MWVTEWQSSLALLQEKGQPSICQSGPIGANNCWGTVSTAPSPSFNSSKCWPPLFSLCPPPPSPYRQPPDKPTDDTFLAFSHLARLCCEIYPDRFHLTITPSVSPTPTLFFSSFSPTFTFNRVRHVPDRRLPAEPCRFRQHHVADRAKALEARFPVQRHMRW